MVFKMYSIKLWFVFKIFYLYLRTLLFKKCIIGPFVGEFGHLLSYIIPFISYLNSKGIKVSYCGPAIHKPFFYDENKNLIVENYFELRDFYNEINPFCNDLIIPDDLIPDINNFIVNSKKSNKPFWNISNRIFYWEVFCRFIYFFGFLKIHDLSKNYVSKKENSVVVFPRKKGASYSPFYGEKWDYSEVINCLKDLFDKVYVVGHPAFSHKLSSYENVIVKITNNNHDVLNICSKSKIIINQFSGTHWLSAYTNTKTIFLFKGKITKQKFNSKVNSMRKRLGMGKILFIFDTHSLRKHLKKYKYV